MKGSINNAKRIVPGTLLLRGLAFAERLLLISLDDRFYLLVERLETKTS